MKKLKSKFTRLTEEAESEFDAASADSDGVEEAPTEADDDDDDDE